MTNDSSDSSIIYLVSVDTRGLPAADLQEGFEELQCSREYFVEHIARHPKTKCVICPLAEICGLSKHLKVYFQEYIPGHGVMGDRPIRNYQDEQAAWSEFFPIGDNNPAATLLTIDPSTGYARYNVQGIAYVVYNDGHYPLSKEQVWGLCEMASEAKDLYFCDESHSKGKYKLGRWCQQYKNRSWGPSSIYEPRKTQNEKNNPSSHGRLTTFGQTVLI